MTPAQYRKSKEEEKKRNEIIQHIMIKYHMEEKDAARFYWERIRTWKEDE